MNHEEARQILLLYRPALKDGEDPQLAEALALARQEPALRIWLEKYCAEQESLRAKFRQIEPPAGLKEQIISEHAAHLRMISRRRAVVFAAAAAIAVCVGLLVFWRPTQTDDLAIYRSRMVRIALSGYSMDLETISMVQIRDFLTHHQSPSDYVLPAGLQNAVITGCAVEKWEGKKVTMVCFHTGQPLSPGEKSDLWLFVMDRTALKNVPKSEIPDLTRVNRLMTATWTEGNKIYLLGVAGDEQTIRSYL